MEHLEIRWPYHEWSWPYYERGWSRPLSGGDCGPVLLAWQPTQHFLHQWQVEKGRTNGIMRLFLIHFFPFLIKKGETWKNKQTRGGGYFKKEKKKGEGREGPLACPFTPQTIMDWQQIQDRIKISQLLFAEISGHKDITPLIKRFLGGPAVHSYSQASWKWCKALLVPAVRACCWHWARARPQHQGDSVLNWPAVSLTAAGSEFFWKRGRAWGGCNRAGRGQSRPSQGWDQQ